MTTVSIVTCTYNSGRDLPPFAEALRAGLSGCAVDRVVIVDNDSPDDTVEVARALDLPGLTVEALSTNGGYAAGVNHGLRVAKDSEAIYVLNPHMHLSPGSTGKLLAELDRDRRVGIAVPKLVHEDGSTMFSLRREPTPLRVLGDAVLGGDRAGRISWLGSSITDPERYDRPSESEWATGGALLIARRCIEEIGEWDESLFMYGEDIEYGLRANQHGFRIRLVPDATATYIGGERVQRADLHTMMTMNKVRLYRARHGRVGSTAFHGALMVNEAVRAARGSAIHKAGLKELAANALDVVADRPLPDPGPPNVRGKSAG